MQVRHSWRCKAKLHTEPLQIDRNHSSEFDFNINIAENQSSSRVEFNDQQILEQTEGLITEYNEQMQKSKNRDNNEVQCHWEKVIVV